jgi:hypothetical protein
MGAKGENYSSQSRAFKARKTTTRECASRGSTASLYRAPCATCNEITLHSRSACVHCAKPGEEKPKLGRRRKPLPVAVAGEVGAAWHRQRTSTPARRETRAAGIAR